MAELSGNNISNIEAKDLHTSSTIRVVNIPWGAGVEQWESATAAAAESFVLIPFNGRLIEFAIFHRSLSAATGETGGLNFMAYIGATATAAAGLFSATARLDTGTTGGVITPNLTTSGVDISSGGVVVSANTVLLLSMVEASASHTVGGIQGNIKIALDF